ncbi:MAG TPA: hypothetical protein VFO56_06715 [Gaiellaceae bacterium]|nr:hypothetical protein [Gaiellaceae bacterium]
MSGPASERPALGVGRERQFEVYVGGARGTYPHVPVSIEQLETRARSAMTPEDMRTSGRDSIQASN